MYDKSHSATPFAPFCLTHLLHLTQLIKSLSCSFACGTRNLEFQWLTTVIKQLDLRWWLPKITSNRRKSFTISHDNRIVIYLAVVAISALCCYFHPWTSAFSIPLHWTVNLTKRLIVTVTLLSAKHSSHDIDFLITTERHTKYFHYRFSNILVATPSRLRLQNCIGRRG